MGKKRNSKWKVCKKWKSYYDPNNWNSGKWEIVSGVVLNIIPENKIKEMENKNHKYKSLATKLSKGVSDE